MRVVAGLVAATLASASALAADVTVVTPPAGVHALILTHLPQCWDPAVLKDIALRFAHQDAVIVHSGLSIVGFDNTAETKFKGRPSLVDVRYCVGRAWLSNGIASEVVYIIEGPMKGPFSVGWAVESCLPAFDPYRVYDGNCRSIRADGV
jgi:hypothetical protein